MENNFSYKKTTLIAEDIRHKPEITFENIFCWNIKEGFVPEHKMAIKEETDEQDMSKGQQKRPSLTGAVLFHCTQIWRRTSSPVLLLGEWLSCLVHKETYWEIKEKAPEIQFIVAETLSPWKPFAAIASSNG